MYYFEVQRAIRKVLAEYGIVTREELGRLVQAVRVTDGWELSDTVSRMEWNGNLETVYTAERQKLIRLPEFV